MARELGSNMRCGARWCVTASATAALMAGVGRRMRVVAGVLVAVALVSSCSKTTGGASGGSAAGGTPRPVVTSPAAAGKALTSSAGQVRAQVQQLQAPLLTGAIKQEILVDDAAPCEIGADGPWPQRWGYWVMVRLKATNPILPAKTLQDHLKKQGWTIRPHETTSDSLDFDARRGGVVLRISGEPNPATVKIEGYGECLGADGKPIG